MSVVLPAPFAPSRPCTPGPSAALTRSTAILAPYSFVSLSNVSSMKPLLSVERRSKRGEPLGAARGNAPLGAQAQPVGGLPNEPERACRRDGSPHPYRAGGICRGHGDPQQKAERAHARRPRNDNDGRIGRRGPPREHGPAGCRDEIRREGVRRGASDGDKDRAGGAGEAAGARKVAPENREPRACHGNGAVQARRLKLAHKARARSDDSRQTGGDERRAGRHQSRLRLVRRRAREGKREGKRDHRGKRRPKRARENLIAVRTRSPTPAPRLAVRAVSAATRAATAAA